MQYPLFAPDSDWRPPSMDSLPSLAGVKRICLDVETKDIGIKQLGPGVRRPGNFISGFCLGIEDGPRYYLPIRHQGGDNLDAAQVIAYLRDQSKHFTGDMVGAKLDYDLDWMLEEGIDWKSVRYFRDIQVAEPLINELHDRFSLEEICKRRGLPGKDETLLREAARAFGVDPKGGMWQLAARFVGPYGEGDTDRPLLISRKQERDIEDRDLWDIYNLESQVTPVLVRMRRRGVRVDLQQLEKIEKWSFDQEVEALRKVEVETGFRVGVGNVWQADALAAPLEAIGVKIEKTANGKPSIRKDILAGLKHPVADALLWARKVNKLRTTFAASVRRYMIGDRIHCTFNQIAREDDDTGDQRGARYGRLSCVDPNMQQQPSRDEFSKEWRKIYIPEEGKQWAACDYSQQEPRWTTHFAGLMNLAGAREACQAYHDDPLLDNHDFMAKLTGLQRKFAKNLFLGLCYGEGGAKLCRDLGLPTRWALAYGRGQARQTEFFVDQREALQARQTKADGYVFEAAGEEGQTIIDTFNNRAPYIKLLAQEAQKVARTRGYIVTGGGRHLHFPQKDDGTYDWTHKSLNRIIQGTSADQVKKALVALDKEGHYLQLQVHDEIDGSVENKEEADAMAAIMRDVMPALVPFRVDVELGDSWGGSMG